MKLKAFILTLFLAAATASVALADDGHGKGKGHDAVAASTSTTGSTTTTTGDEHGKSDEHKADAAKKHDACKPSFSLNLQGTVAAAPTATSVAVLVVKGNGHAKALAGKQVTVDASTAKVVKQGQKKLADLVAGDRVEVKARACANADLTTLSLVATQIVVLGAKGKDDDDDDHAKPVSSSTSTTTTTTAAPTTTR
jgi:hypothetical protein